MILKKQSKKLKKKINLSLFYKYYFFLTIFLFSFSSIVFFNSGIWSMYKEKIYDRLNIYGFTNYKHLPSIALYSLRGFFTEVDTLYLNINYKQLIKLEKNRSDKKKIQEGYLFPYDNGSGYPFNFTWRNANIRLNDESEKNIRIRLKGARSIHWEDEKYSSYRIRLKNDEKLFGTKVFNLQKPRARNYLHEWIFHKLCEELELVSIKYNFLKLNKNGENKGLYVIEESFSNELVERNSRRNGPIFSLDEDLSVDQSKSFFEVYDKKKWENKVITKIAAKKLELAFHDGQSIDEFSFDLKKWAKYFAIIDLTQAYHGVLPKSVKYFYNSVSGVIEPIGYDGHYFELSKIDGSNIQDNAGRYYDLLIEFLENNQKYAYKFTNAFLKNEKFKKYYFEYLHKISSTEFLNYFFEKNKDQINRNLSLIYSDYFFNDHAFFYGPGIYFFDKKEFYDRAEVINKKIKIYKQKVKIVKDRNNINIYNNNLNKFIKPIQINCNNIDYEIFNINLNNLVSEKKLKNCRFVKFLNQIDNSKFNVNINYYNKQSFNFQKLENYSKNLKKYFLVDGINLYLKEDKIEIKEDLFIPKNFTVNLRSGDEIRIFNNSMIFSKANWVTKTSKNEYVKIYSVNEGESGGIFIFDNDKKTSLNNVIFSNLGYLNRYSINNFNEKELISNFNLLGAVNFYETNIKLNNCKFENIFSEDALNIISSDFEITESKFLNLKYDAIDLDFTKGKIKNSYFENIGNDAIDFSGSNSKIINVTAKNIGDKVISVGEKSDIKIVDLSALNAKVGIASKDSSLVNAKNVKFDVIEYPIASYKKKNEFDGAYINLSGFDSRNFKTKFVQDSYSTIDLDGKKIKKNFDDVMKIIYGS